jgi:hypothetical protein
MAPRLLSYDDARKLPPAQRTAGSLYWSSVTCQTERLKSCRCCGFSYCGGVNRAKIHLLGKGKDGVRSCTYVNDDKAIELEFLEIKAEGLRREDAEKGAAALKSRAMDDEAVADVAAMAGASSSLGSALSQPAGTRSLIVLSQPTIAHAFRAQSGKIPSADEVSGQWSRALVATGTPFFHVDNPEFRKAVLMTAQAGPSYVRLDSDTLSLEPLLPKRKKLATNLLDATDRECMQMVEQIKRATIGDTGCAIVSDGLSNIKCQPLVNVLTVLPGGQYFSGLINGEGETKDNRWIANRLIEAIEAEGPENVVILLMDGACRGAFPLINAVYPHIICQVCIAHSLDLLLEDFAKEGTQGPVVAGEERLHYDTSWTREHIAAGRKIVRFLTSHHKLLFFYRQIVKSTPKELLPKGGTELLKPAETRFGSNFMAMQRLVSVQPQLEKLVVSNEWAGWVSKQTSDVKEKALEIKKLSLPGGHWDEKTAIVAGSEPIFALLRLCDGERP